MLILYRIRFIFNYHVLLCFLRCVFFFICYFLYCPLWFLKNLKLNKKMLFYFPVTRLVFTWIPTVCSNSWLITWFSKENHLNLLHRVSFILGKFVGGNRAYAVCKLSIRKVFFDKDVFTKPCSIDRCAFLHRGWSWRRLPRHYHFYFLRISSLFLNRTKEVLKKKFCEVLPCQCIERLEIFVASEWVSRASHRIVFWCLIPADELISII